MAVNESLIERREYKYLVDEEMAQRIRGYIKPFCILDKNAEARGGTYIIDSLYLDTPKNDLFWANDHEACERFKLRIRTYPVEDCTEVFLEVKKRINDVIAKTRGKLPKSCWQDFLLHPDPRAWKELKGKERRAVDRFIALTHSLCATPRVLVRYEREPYMSLIDDYARVTFDRKVQSKQVSDWTLDAPDENWRRVDHALNTKSERSLSILELKFTSAVPLWMVNLVKTLQLQRLSFSKYATSMVAWSGRAPEMREAGRNLW